MFVVVCVCWFGVKDVVCMCLLLQENNGVAWLFLLSIFWVGLFLLCWFVVCCVLCVWLLFLLIYYVQNTTTIMYLWFC